MSARVDHDLVIIGSGFSGVGMAIAAKAAGRDYLVLEKADEIGGTWRDNRYPGCACDVPSHLYSFSFEPNPYWSRAYATADEIQDYLLFCVEKYGIREQVRFDSTVQQMTYDDGLGAWHLSVASSAGEIQHIVAGAVVLGVGALHDPVLPDIPGIEHYAGEVMHTAAWDVNATMFGKKVGIIGTGCSAVQAIPHLAEDATHLTVFQRTPVWVLPKLDPEFPEWLIDAYEKRPWLTKLHRARIKAYNEVRSLAFTKQPALLKAMSKVALHHMHSAVKDPELREKLTPSYTMGCKRITMSNTYFPTLARDDVTLETSSITGADATGLITADGTHHTLDAVVFATGFDVAGSYRHLDVTGLQGHRLADDWDAGIDSFYGVTVPHYPNLFFLLGPNTGLGHTSVLLMIEAQIRLIDTLLDERDKRGVTAVAVRPQIVPAHMAQIARRSDDTVWKSGGCNSWYLDERGENRSLWPESVIAYERKLARPDFVDYEFTGSAEF
ncbi:flavin-containing monooxygenase [Rudaeicoccus suwonensis]|uniref:Cation diffusion facilitator CzcD-associated flavoprotein CzcO n=1 Tax=Rudaeicoccus suwonensis TaxID=657409 RepID=A0A561E783_9MICO|nr:NAD(P)/FAD-dependent oxidoreductase [Rudaeicoccus suwonensis]TWE11478.1 cation diffusion facilitator CzcD-associated flavoprotein CzcO [Rudaeicoccus suwonensis]